MPPLEWENLQQLASATGAQIKRLSNNDRDITALLSSVTQLEQFKKDDDEKMEFDQWLDSGYWLVLPLLVLCLGAFRKGIILSIALMIFIGPKDSFAQTTLPDVLLNGDQQGEKYFEQNPAKAAESFSDLKWKASSLYKAGDYQGALDIWQQFDDAQSLYNQGNALAQLQQIDKAIAAYEAALKKQNDLEDAKANKALLEQLKQNQDNSQQQNQDGSDSQDSSEQNQDSSESSDQNSEQQNQSQNSDSKDAQSQDSQSSDSNEPQENQRDSDQQSAQASDTNTQSENPLEQAQTEEEKQRQEEMDAMKEQMAQQTQDEQNNENEGEQGSLQAQPKSQADLEQEQAMQQWIQRIPDDPGGLLRNKFLYQYQQRQGNTEQNGERKPW